MVMLSLGMAALTGLAAQVRVPLLNTPVPVTAQVFAVLVSGVLLGGGYGALSQVIYIGLGFAGLPWFSGGAAGFLPATGGYILGFVPAAILVGYLSDRFVGARSLVPQVGVMLAGVAVIYLSGAAQFSLMMGTGFGETLSMAVLPFIAFDILKAVAAAGVASSILPRRDYHARG
jgi:biotin transport system substrate-specific component